jgi:L-lactate dehydrogenase (cytochrome)
MRSGEHCIPRCSNASLKLLQDAVLAAEAGVDGILISNHGGRQLDYSMPSIEVLYRLRQQRPDILNKIEVYIDGGVRRGTGESLLRLQLHH